MMDELRTYDRVMLRSAFQSLFWNVLLTRKRQTKFTFKALADKLGINKSYVSRSFSSPPNWQIDKVSDMADALGVDLIIEARDRKNPNIVYTPSGIRQTAVTSSSFERVLTVQTGTRAPTTSTNSPDHPSLVKNVLTEVA
jgi:DNA-binding phage protein